MFNVRESRIYGVIDAKEIETVGNGFIKGCNYGYSI